MKLETVAGSVDGLHGSVRALETAHQEQRVLVIDVRERVADLSERVDLNRDTAAEGLATHSRRRSTLMR